MSRIAFNGNALGTGTFTIASPNSNSDRTVTLPDQTGTLVLSGNSASFTSAAVSGATTTGSLAVNGDNISATNSLGFRNRILNGGMVIDQRNAGASVTGNSGVYPVDRWSFNNSQSSKFTAQRNAGSVTPPSGFTNYLGVTSSSAYSVLSSDYFGIGQSVEGFNVADLGYGAAGAQTITLSFWVRSSLTGTFSVAITNSAFSRGYVTTYTINAANTWEQKSVTIPGDTTGTWLTNNEAGLRLFFNLGAGSGQNATPNTWGSWVGWGVSGATSVVGTNGATFYITGVQLEAGSVASPFERRDYGRELAMCQRYFCNSVNTNNVTSGGVGLFYAWSTSEAGGRVGFPVQMRATPTIVTYDNAGTSGSGNMHNTGTGSNITGVTADWINSAAWTHITKSAGWSAQNMIVAGWTASAEL
jgi:hypothetical protein